MNDYLKMMKNEAKREAAKERGDNLIILLLTFVAVIASIVYEVRLFDPEGEVTYRHILKIFIQSGAVGGLVFLASSALKIDLGPREMFRHYRRTFFLTLAFGLLVGVLSAAKFHVGFIIGAAFAGTMFLFLVGDHSRDHYLMLMYGGYCTGFIPAMILVLPIFKALLLLALIACSAIAFFAVNLSLLASESWRIRQERLRYLSRIKCEKFLRGMKGR